MTLSGKYLSLLLAAVCVALSVANHPAHRVYRLGPHGHGSTAGRALPGEYGGVARDNIVFTEGLLRPGDELYFDYRLSCVGETDVSVSQEVTFMHMVGNFTYVQVTELGASQNATASIVEGGLACWYLTVNVLSDLSRGYDALIEVYGSPYFRGGYGVQEVSYDDFSRLKREEICEDP